MCKEGGTSHDEDKNEDEDKGCNKDSNKSGGSNMGNNMVKALSLDIRCRQGVMISKLMLTAKNLNYQFG